MLKHPTTLMLKGAISMCIYTIYKIECIINNKIYIGFDSNYPSRINDHVKTSLGNKLNYILHKAIRKYGWDNFKYQEIYQSLDKDHCLKVMENYFINEYKSYYLLENSNGYNMTLGGEGIFGYKHTAQTKENMLLRNRTTTTGKQHYKYDETIHHFVNRKTGEEVYMTQNDFFKKYKLAASGVNAIINGRFTSYKEWHIHEKETKERVSGKNHHNYNSEVHSIIHIDTNEIKSGTLRELVITLNLNHHANLRSMLRGDRHSVRGWRLHK